ncbi:LCP family protein [Chakrabartyella piscis]|uniref:LCP family protein n=1 Tax=Chakrabartyella piscis TaxID=2918914 RepID=UPI002958AF09|nr:LCP family protein [Chakrabartyella piscis]
MSNKDEQRSKWDGQRRPRQNHEKRYKENRKQDVKRTRRHREEKQELEYYHRPEKEQREYRPEFDAMQRNRRIRRKKEAKKKKQNLRIVIWLVVLAIFFGVVYAGSKAMVTIKTWESKAEVSDFQAVNFTVSSSAPVKTSDQMVNIAVFATDEDGYRADVNFLVNFNMDTMAINLISVPRDTRVTMTPDMTSYLESLDRYVPEQNGVYGQCKLTEVHAYAGSGNRNTFSVAMMEKILDVEIDYYVKVNIDGFIDIVDAIGGVDMYVPMDMYWDMSDTGGPIIDLQEGYQHLNGEAAEQLVRFREGYAAKDLARIETQQAFMTAFMEKIMSTESLLNNMDNLVKVALDNTESNVTLADALGYLQYLPQIDLSKVTMVTIPGEGGSYFDHDVEGTKELIDELVYGKVEVTAPIDVTEDEVA